MGTQKELMWEGKVRCRELEKEVCLSSLSTDISWFLLGEDNVNGVDGGLVCLTLGSPKTDPERRTQRVNLGHETRNAGGKVKN